MVEPIILKDVFIIKKDTTKEVFNSDKIVKAIQKSASRTLFKFTDEQLNDFVKNVVDTIKSLHTDTPTIHIDIKTIHSIVEKILEDKYPSVAKSYKDYRNYKTDFTRILDKVFQRSQTIRYIGDKENSNSDSSLVSTKRSLIYKELNKELYKKFFLNEKEKQAIRDGYIYIHDMSDRLDTLNCCISDISAILDGGFEMGNVWYNEPKTISTAFDVIGDIVLSSASQMYGGYTIPSVDNILLKYAVKSYEKYKHEYEDIVKDIDEYDVNIDKDKQHEYALFKLENDIKQGFQGWEYKFNTVSSSRGDYPFISVTLGTGTHLFSQLISKICLQVRRNGQGKDGFKKPVLFPKLIFLYDEQLHGQGKVLESVFDEAIETSRHTMYPDFLSLSGNGYVPSIYKKYGEVIHPMGCRAFLSPYWLQGELTPNDDTDKPVFTGRANMGLISFHLNMILAKSKRENKDFYEVLDYYLELSRQIHLKTIDYLGELKASINPLMFCEGGFYKGNLKHNEKIKPVLKSFTVSFGITGLNELNQLYNKKSLREDGKFPLEVMEYINKKANEFKEQDNILYAVYGTPAESLVGKQVEQFRKQFGIVENVSDREYISNSFHLHVSEDVTPIEKQDKEVRFWDYFNGGKIQYVKYPINYNIEAVKTLVRRAMSLGLYEGINLSLSYCDDCGYQELDMDVCPKCGSSNLTKIERMNGYLSYSRVNGDTRLNSAKMSEIKDRVSM